jgi:hypothetical protein
MYLENLETLKKALISLQAEDSIKSFLLFCADKDAPLSDEIEEVLRLNSKPLAGGIFPEIISLGQRYVEGFLLISMPEHIDTFLYEEKNSFQDFIKHIKLVQIKSDAEHFTLFTFVNAFWSKKKKFLTKLYDYLGPFVNYLGGGAGSLSFKSKPCIFYNQRVVENAAVLGLMRKHSHIGVAHGWKSISEPIKVTETSGNEIISLNWKPAFEVYKNLIYSHSRQDISSDNFFDVAKSYPLGLVRFGDEMIIRDPFATVDGKLIIVDEVPSGEYIRIMHGDIDSLVNGANRAFMQAHKNDYSKLGEKFCIDCISRVLFMNDDFDKELMVLNQNSLANGILSLGEIANPGNSTLEIFNKTAVVAQWKKTS